MTQTDIDKRVQCATDLFLQGYNCAQAVAGALADLYDIDRLNALRMSAAFGGGLGRMRLTCGAVSGMCIMAGYENGQTQPNDPEQKLTNYSLVRELTGRFEKEHGSITCSELLAMRAARLKENGESASTMQADDHSARPAERTEAYYHQRPCLVQITSAVRIFCEAYNRLHPDFN